MLFRSVSKNLSSRKMSFRGQVMGGRIRSRVQNKHTQSAQIKSIKWFENFCQDAVKRVQQQAQIDNQELNQKIQIAEGRQAAEKIGAKYATISGEFSKPRSTVTRGPRGTSGKALRQRLQTMEDTKHERCFKNYEKYLQKWSNYEKQVEEHFKNRDALKYGSA